MADNAQISVSSTLKVTSNQSEEVSQVSSGSISIDEYVTYVDTLAPSTVQKSYNFGASPTYDFINLEVNGPVTVFFSALGTAIPLSSSVVSGTKRMGKMTITGSSFTDLFISNADTQSSVQIKITLAKYAS